MQKTSYAFSSAILQNTPSSVLQNIGSSAVLRNTANELPMPEPKEVLQFQTLVSPYADPGGIEEIIPPKTHKMLSPLSIRESYLCAASDSEVASKNGRNDSRSPDLEQTTVLNLIEEMPQNTYQRLVCPIVLPDLPSSGNEISENYYIGLILPEHPSFPRSAVPLPPLQSTHSSNQSLTNVSQASLSQSSIPKIKNQNSFRVLSLRKPSLRKIKSQQTFLQNSGKTSSSLPQTPLTSRDLNTPTSQNSQKSSKENNIPKGPKRKKSFQISVSRRF